jgi:hypothetical protein
MRVTSGLWVGAYVRRCFAEGAIVTVARRGVDEAGAILVVVDRLDGTADLYGPAPQSVFSDARPSDRLFQIIMEDSERSAIDARLASELRFDPDVWIVEVEDRGGRAFLDLAAP